MTLRNWRTWTPGPDARATLRTWVSVPLPLYFRLLCGVSQFLESIAPPAAGIQMYPALFLGQEVRTLVTFFSPESHGSWLPLPNAHKGGDQSQEA